MPIISRGFRGRRPSGDHELPPGQYETFDFPVLSAGPTPHVPLDEWEFTIGTETGTEYRWTWDDLMALPAETPTVDLHCVTKWSKFDTQWRAFLWTFFSRTWRAPPTSSSTPTAATPRISRWRICSAKAWIAYCYDGEELPAEHGGPARLLVPHLYFWKSAKWVRGIRLGLEDEPGSGRPLATTTTETHGASSGTRATRRAAALAGRRAAGRRAETATAVTLVFDVAGWPGHVAGQHVDAGSPPRTVTARSAATRSRPRPTASASS